MALRKETQIASRLLGLNSSVQMPKRILIADDHESVLRRVRAIVESQPGWQVCGDATNGRDTIAKAIELKPDLVVLDFAMPQLDGLKSASAIKTVLPELPIIMFTMYCSAVRQEAEKHGISRVIDKAESEALVGAIVELLGTQVQELVDQNPEKAAPLSPSTVAIVAETDINQATIRKAS